MTRKPRKRDPRGIESRERILEVIIGHIERVGYPPTYREMMKATGIKSESAIGYHLDMLERDGLIERKREIARGIRIPDKTREEFSIIYKCLYPFGCREEADRPGTCLLHGTELTLFITRRK